MESLADLLDDPLGQGSRSTAESLHLPLSPANGLPLYQALLADPPRVDPHLGLLPPVGLTPLTAPDAFTRPMPPTFEPPAEPVPGRIEPAAPPPRPPDPAPRAGTRAAARAARAARAEAEEAARAEHADGAPRGEHADRGEDGSRPPRPGRSRRRAAIIDLGENHNSPFG